MFPLIRALIRSLLKNLSVIFIRAQTTFQTFKMKAKASQEIVPVMQIAGRC